MWGCGTHKVRWCFSSFCIINLLDIMIWGEVREQLDILTTHILHIYICFLVNILTHFSRHQICGSISNKSSWKHIMFCLRSNFDRIMSKEIGMAFFRSVCCTSCTANHISNIIGWKQSHELAEFQTRTRILMRVNRDSCFFLLCLLPFSFKKSNLSLT